MMKDIVTDTDERPHVVCIVGMHRSGTSMVARLLRLCGLELGPADRLEGPSLSNAMGHFEHTGFVEIDDALLNHFGGSWDQPPDLELGWEMAPSLGKIARDAESLLQTFSGYARWGWKDPRTTLVLPFWQKLIPNLRYVICVRNPLEVAQSLAMRDNMSIGAGAHLWNRYMREAIRNTEGSPAIFTFYEDYFRDALAEIDRVVAFCGLTRGDSFVDVQNAIAHELRHYTNESFELLHGLDIPTEYKILYLGLRALSSQESKPVTSSEKMTSCTGKFLELIEELHEEELVAKLQDHVAEKDKDIYRLKTIIREKDEYIARIQEHNYRLQTFANAVKQTLAYRFYRRFIKQLKPD
jgi:hypothetical protein